MTTLTDTQRKALETAAANPAWGNWDAVNRKWEVNPRTVRGLVAKGLLREEPHASQKWILVITDAGREALKA